MLTRLVCVLMVCAALVSPALAQNRAKIERDFQTWLLQEIWPAARKAGVSRSTFDRSFRGVSLNWDLPDLVPPGSNRQAPRAQRQAEFGAPGRYFGRGAVNGASATGRQMQNAILLSSPRWKSAQVFLDGLSLRFGAERAPMGKRPFRIMRFRFLEPRRS